MNVHKIRWRACGFDHADRKGEAPGAPDLQITYNCVHKNYELFFGWTRKGEFPDIKQARAFAEANLETWIEARRAQKAEEQEKTRLELARARQAEADRAELAARLGALGVEVKLWMNSLTLTDATARELIERLSQPRT